ncbi:MAG: hypothetical protein WCJ01_06165 [Ignavibacteria bacterium]
MTENEKIKLDMYESVLTLFAENSDIISHARVLRNPIAKLKNIIDEIRKKDHQISSKTFEITIQTEKIKNDLIFNLVSVASALFLFARKNGNIFLKEKTRISHSYLDRILDRELIGTANVLITLADQNFYNLKKFNIKRQTLATLSEQVALFKNSLNNKIASLTATSELTPLKDLFDEADRVFSKHIDVHMENLISTNEDFYDDYIWTRNIENLDKKRL